MSKITIKTVFFGDLEYPNRYSALVDLAGGVSILLIIMFLMLKWMAI